MHVCMYAYIHVRMCMCSYVVLFSDLLALIHFAPYILTNQWFNITKYPQILSSMELQPVKQAKENRMRKHMTN